MTSGAKQTGMVESRFHQYQVSVWAREARKSHSLAVQKQYLPQLLQLLYILWPLACSYWLAVRSRSACDLLFSSLSTRHRWLVD